jgi:hypothetical protein
LAKTPTIIPVFNSSQQYAFRLMYIGGAGKGLAAFTREKVLALKTKSYAWTPGNGERITGKKRMLARIFASLMAVAERSG